MSRDLYTNHKDQVGLGENIAERIFRRRRRVVINRKKYPKIQLYKYLNAEDVHYFTQKESVKLSGLTTYAARDAVAGVGDPKEKDYGKVNRLIVDAGSLNEQKVLKNLSALDIYIGPDEIGNHPQNITMEVEMPKVPNRFVQCFSTEFSHNDMERWKSTPDAKYDACLKINDAVEYCRIIQNVDFLGHKKLGSHAIIDHTVYEEYPLDLAKVDFSYFQFIKDRDQFSWQKEIRLSWPSIISAMEPDYFLNVPGLSKLVERVC